MTLLHPLPVNGPYSSFWLLSKAIVNTLTAVHTSIAETGGQKQVPLRVAWAQIWMLVSEKKTNTMQHSAYILKNKDIMPIRPPKLQLQAGPFALLTMTDTLDCSNGSYNS